MKVQLVCPKCNHEFQYNNGYFDKNIAQLGIEIETIKGQLAEHKLKPKNEQYANTEWWLKTKRALTIKQKQLAELKAFRKVADQQREKQEFQAFKNAVKELCGEKIYKQCLEIMLETTKAYNISDTAKVGYTRAKGEVLISVNKI
jgi:ribonuclease D